MNFFYIFKRLYIYFADHIKLLRSMVDIPWSNLLVINDMFIIYIQYIDLLHLSVHIINVP